MVVVVLVGVPDVGAAITTASKLKVMGIRLLLDLKLICYEGGQNKEQKELDTSCRVWV